MRRTLLLGAGAAALVAYIIGRRTTPSAYFSARQWPNHAIPLNIPGPPAMLGGAGNVLTLMRDPLKLMGTWFERYGPLFVLAHGTRTQLVSPLPDCPGTLFVTTPALVREVVTQHDTFYRYSAVGSLYPIPAAPPRLQPLRQWGAGLFNVNANTHRQQRRLMLPAFHRKRVDGYRDLIVAIVEQVLDSWSIGEERNIHHEMMLLTMRVATSALFGSDVASAGEQISRNIEKSLHVFANPITSLLRVDLPGFPYHHFLNLTAAIAEGIQQIIAQKRASGIDSGDVLAMLIQARDEEGVALSEEELVGHVSLLFAAGHETSSNALTWTLFLLSQHPEIAKALYTELDHILHGAAPTVAQLAQLPLLERVIKESMRLFPPVPWNTRVSYQPTELDGHTIPPGTEIVMSIYHIHHDPAIYPEPERFNPARWETIDPSTFEYSPFSGGPRMCIGSSFAMLEMKIALAMLVQRYRLELVPHAKVERLVTVTMAPRYGMPMVICPQDGQFPPPAAWVGNAHEMVSAY